MTSRIDPRSIKVLICDSPRDTSQNSESHAEASLGNIRFLAAIPGLIATPKSDSKSNSSKLRRPAIVVVPTSSQNPPSALPQEPIPGLKPLKRPTPLAPLVGNPLSARTFVHSPDNIGPSSAPSKPVVKSKSKEFNT